MQSTFSGGTDWAVGEIYGHRAFNLKRNGMLYSPIMSDYKWFDGVNTSQCSFNCHQLNSKRQPNCSCGYYAYYDPDDQHVEGNTMAIIRGYGMVDRGEFGFKAEKAVIEAVYLPTKYAKEDDVVPVVKKPKDIPYYRRGAVVSGSILALDFMLLSTLLSANVVLGALIAGIVMIVAMVGYIKSLRGISTAKHKKGSMQSYRNEELPDNCVNLIKQNYPNTKIYFNHQQMINDYEDKMPKNGRSYV